MVHPRVVFSFRILCGVALLGLFATVVRAELSDVSIRELTAKIKQVSAGGVGHADAMAASKELASKANANHITPLLAAMDDANPLALNWLQNVVETVADRAASIPQDAVRSFVLDRNHGAQARRLAYDLLVARDASAESLLVPGMLDDPALDLRFEAVEKLAAQAESKTAKEEKIQVLLQSLSASRDSEQVDRIIASLGKLERKIDVAQHYGFLMKWRMVGPFDNTGQKGFDVAYPPESDTKATSFPGKKEDVTWRDHASTAADGVIKLTEIYGPEKGAIVYVMTELNSEKEQPAEVRVGCINACKVWINGTLLMSHEKYHQAMMVDQYVSATTLKEGRNEILMKICQNEQTEPWAQDWMYQLRVTTPDGLPIRAEQAKP